MALGLGVLIGLVLGLTGAGGGVLAVPLLIWGLGWSLPQAAPVALLAVCVAASFGTVVAWDTRYVRYRAATLMAGAGLVAAPLGLALSGQVPERLLEGLFAALLVLVALRSWRQRDPVESQLVPSYRAGDGDDFRCGLDVDTGRIHWTPRCVVAIGGSGLLTGLIAGLFGVGGGFVIVPLLRLLTPLSLHSAIATALMAVALTSAGTVGVAVLQGRELPLLVAVPFMLGAVAGMLLGRRLAPRLPARALGGLFIALVLVVAMLMSIRALGVV